MIRVIGSGEMRKAGGSQRDQRHVELSRLLVTHPLRGQLVYGLLCTEASSIRSSRGSKITSSRGSKITSSSTATSRASSTSSSSIHSLIECSQCCRIEVCLVHVLEADHGRSDEHGLVVLLDRRAIARVEQEVLGFVADAAADRHRDADEEHTEANVQQLHQLAVTVARGVLGQIHPVQGLAAAVQVGGVALAHPGGAIPQPEGVVVLHAVQGLTAHQVGDQRAEAQRQTALRQHGHALLLGDEHAVHVVLDGHVVAVGAASQMHKGGHRGTGALDGQVAEYGAAVGHVVHRLGGTAEQEAVLCLGELTATAQQLVVGHVAHQHLEALRVGHVFDQTFHLLVRLAGKHYHYVYILMKVSRMKELVHEGDQCIGFDVTGQHHVALLCKDGLTVGAGELGSGRESRGETTTLERQNDQCHDDHHFDDHTTSLCCR
mmetsp:Transcript_6863/g.20915  ORF Transcript_6863/g.20915 Transcript_6863/m.20915 type:complete len:433 (-) Transcript_6863:1395-2693(-)